MSVIALFLKQRTEYMNGDKTPYSYYKITSEGKITGISTARNRISSPRSLSIQKGFEIITEEEFNTVLKEMMGNLNIQQ